MSASADLSLSATSVSLAAGDTTTIALTGAGTSTVSWSSDDPSVATVTGDSSSAVVRAIAPGTTTITAKVGSESVSATVTVGSSRLVSIAITPPTLTLPHAMVFQLSAVGTYSDATVKNISSDATWTSSDDAVASVDGNGALTGGDPGMATITATVGNITATMTVTVTNATLSSIAITPPNPTLPLAFSQQLHATGMYSDGTTLDLTAQVGWASQMTDVATITTAGVVSTLTSGTSTISATLGTTTGTTTLTVSTASLVSIAVTPSASSLAIGVTQQYTATGKYSDNSTHDLTGQVTWAASGTAATISATGLATAAVAGTSTITATLGAISGSTTLAVTSQTIVSIAIDPPNPTVSVNGTQQFSATATLSDNTTATITDAVVWSVDAHASISNVAGSKGLATGTSVGTAMITATIMAGGVPVSGSTNLSVVSRQLMSIAVSPTGATLPSNWKQQFTAQATYDDTTTADITNDVTWDSDSHAVIQLSNAAADKGTGYTATTTGTTNVTATLGTVVGTAPVTVSAITLQSITVDPPTASVQNGADQQYTATGVFSDNSVLDMTTLVTWSSSSDATATISNAAGSQGKATTHAVGGPITISATFLTTTGTAQLTVTGLVLQSIAITPATATTAIGLTTQFTATATYSDTSTADITNDVTWASSAAAATISNADGSHGLATGAALGPTNITATLGSVTSNTAVLTVASIMSIAVTPDMPSVPNGLTQQFTATATFDNADTADITQSVTWASGTAGVATISNTAGSKGLAKAVAGTGTSTISATFGSAMGSTTLTATAAIVQSITMSSTAVTLSLGNNTTITATGHFSDGTTASVNGVATWTSTDSTIASVTTTGTRGIVSAIATGGPVTITAAVTVGAGTVTGTTAVTVVGLQISSIAPANGIAGVRTNAPIVVTFDHAIDLTTVTVQAADDETCTGSVQVSKDDFASCIGLTVASTTAASATINPAAAFTADATYKVRVTTAIKSTATGAPSLAADFTQANGWTIGDTTCTSPIVISQVYGGGGNSGATYNEDFVELHNRSADPESIGGMAIQYASAAGSSWSTNIALPNATIPGGGYYLVGLHAGTTGVALPTPDLVGTIDMSGTGGKVALTITSVTLPALPCPTQYTVDFVGFGTANCFEGTAATPAPSNTSSVIRATNGCTDANANNTDFAANPFATGIAPRNSATTAVTCSGSCAP
ncbi:MAG: Ig-like domain-containing protein [Kofleriaceae bacterium]